MKRAERKRLADIARIENDPKIKYCYVYKLGAYYANNCRGYATDLYNAGVYEKEKAIEICKACTHEIPIPVNIMAHNSLIIKEISRLSKLLIDEK